MQEWAEATVMSSTLVGPGLYRLSVQVSREVADAFHRPGQYHWVRLAQAGEAPYAIASAPGSDVFEYLVRRAGLVSSAWTDLEPGGAFEVSRPEGPGFPLAQARGRPVWLVGTGTGWGPLRSVLQALVADRAAFGPVRAVYGAHSPEQLAFSEEFEGLRAAGIEVVPTVTAPSDAWRGAVGHVQRHLGPALPDGAVAFLCGQAEMTREVTALLAERGVPAGRVFLNA